jgi:alkaline phosphatase D
MKRKDIRGRKRFMGSGDSGNDEKMKGMALALGMLLCATGWAGPVYQATGIKICEVNTHSCIVWTRLTRNEQPAAVDGPLPEVTYGGRKRNENIEDRPDIIPLVVFPENATVENLQGAAPGVPGQTRVLYRNEGEKGWQETPWSEVDPQKDFTRQQELRNLEAGRKYEVKVEGRGSEKEKVSSMTLGKFRTAPAADVGQPVKFAVVSCQDYFDRDLPQEGWKIHRAILSLDPDFFIHTGDNLYYDSWAKTLPLARWMWQQLNGMPTQKNLTQNMATYFMKDDHDAWMNDCFPTMKTKFMGDFTFAEGLGVFREQVGMGEKTYRTVRWGKDLQIWMAEGRDFRSPNDMQDGPRKSIWGEEQKKWFKDSVAASDATFRILISPTPLVGPDRDNKSDNHANKVFGHEGVELREFCSKQKNMLVICGDRHWQYFSIDPKTGLKEFGSGATTDAHAAGWPKDRKDPEQVYVKVVGGFLEGSVDRKDGKARLSLRHHGVDGAVLHEEVIAAQ